MSSNPLNKKSLDFSFVDSDTGEVIYTRSYEVFDTESNYATVDFVSDKLLAKYLASFKRGCIKSKKLSLIINYNESTVF